MSDEEKGDEKEVNKNDEEEENEEVEEEEDRKKRLEKGDYVIQVHVIEARDLKPRDFGDTSDPVAEVTVMSVKKSTQIHKESLNVVFDERLTFDFKGLEPGELNQGKCIIEVFDANVIRKNVLIGSFEFDLTQVYYKKHHELYKQWVALTDVTGDNEGVQGYLQVTIVVLGPKDEQYIHPESEEFETEGSLLNVMMPPQVETDPHLLNVYIHQLDKLMIMDKLTKSSDPYVLIKFAGVENKTTTYKKKLDVHVHEKVTIPVMEPLLGNTIILHVKDHDLTSKDEIIGTATFQYSKVKKNGMNNRWIHMYGAPSGQQKKTADKMNRAIIEGPTYRGSLLLAMDVKSDPTDDELKAQCIDCKASWNKKNAPKITQWVLQVDVYQGVEVGDGKGKFQIRMNIRDLRIRTEYVTCQKGSCEWYEILKLPDADAKDDTIDLRMPADPTQCPDVIFYLVEKKTGFDTSDNIISYLRFSWKDLLKKGFGAPPEWYTFKSSEVLQKLGEDEFPGTILLGIRAGLKDDKPKYGVPVTARPFLNIDASENKDPLEEIQSQQSMSANEPSISSTGNKETDSLLFSQSSTRKRSMGRHPSKLGAAETMGQLQVTVVNAQNVPAMDRGGTSDPYVEVTVNSTTQKTSVQKDTLKPTWNETFTYNGISIHDSMTMQLNDWNRFGKKTKIGRVENIILMGLLQEAKGQLGVDFNYTKKFFVSEKFTNCTVTISISFDFDAKQAQQRREKKTTIGIFDKVTKEKTKNRVNGVAIMGRPYPRNYKMVAYIYQARNLEALDDSGFSDPYLEITYCGKRAKTKTIKKTLNPQWMEAVTLNVDVPQPAAYAPRIRCSVYDWDRFTGNDLIGHFFIPFLDVLDMMSKRKPRWYTLSDQKGEPMEGKVYIAVEFIDANQKNEPIFKIDKTANPFYLHLLTIGVRALKSALGVHKPQVVYTAPLAGSVEEIATDPSSNPSSKNANFLVIQKLPIKIPIDYELAPVINIIARDNLFGGLVKRSIGSSIIDLHEFMIPIKGSDKNEWRIRDNRIEILNEKQLKLEIMAEERAERREYKAERRMDLLSIKKAVELSEARCQNRPFNKNELSEIEEIGKKAVMIETEEEYRLRKFAEEDEYRKEQEREEQELEKRKQQQIEHEKRKREIEKKHQQEMKVEEEEEEEKDDEKEQKQQSEQPETDKKEKKKKKKKKKRKKSKNKVDDGTDDNEEDDSDDSSSSSSSDESSSEEESEEDEDEDDDIKEEDKPKEKIDAKTKKEKEKKQSEKQKRKAEEKKLKEWDKENEDQCFDLDSKVTVNPEDFEPEYLKGRPRIYDELEDNVDCNPFETIDLWTGQKGSLFGGRRVTGKIKGLWKLDVNGDNPFGNGLKALVQTRTIAVRLYILNGINLVSTDRDNSSDPYLVVKLGKTKFSTRKRYIPNTLQPQFHEPFEFHTTLPGPSHITIEIWDWDGIGDDLVGKTVIDIEDRWFSKVWRRLKIKPLEERTLHNPRSAASFGKLRLWIDLLSKETARDIPMTDISLPPKQDYEFRLIVWKAKDVVIKDELTDQNDLRVTVKLTVDEKLKQETDTHWRAKFGKGSWNWRCVFNIGLPFKKRTLLHLSMWDQDVFSASDSIGEINFSLDLLLRHAYLHREDIPRIILRKDQEKRFWLNMMHTKWPGEVQGKLQVSMELMTAEEAAKFPAGLGRGDPNMNPYLPEPEGRFRWSLNPFSMLKQLLGDKLYYKICGGICCIACAAVLIFFGPQLFITLMSNLIVGQ